MRSRHVTALLGACLALSALGYARPAHADAQLYVGGQVGYNWVLGNDTLDDDIGYGAVLGVDFAGLGASGVALEFTALYASYDAASCGTIASCAGLGNGATELCRGIRNGLDVVKALAMGAKAVLIGRPWAWAVAGRGEAGVKHVLAQIRNDMEVAMALTGVTDVADLDHTALVDPPS